MWKIFVVIFLVIEKLFKSACDFYRHFYFYVSQDIKDKEEISEFESIAQWVYDIITNV